ncbi:MULTISPECIES: RNA polymerase sigma factor [Bacteroides]|uniref:Sigma-70 family RNA polymerase sigma factor n=1 Tax=Bacteroides gallinaceum TaxID=1462571 RepID=A0ABT7VIK7_9BACE|nr:MULTISPECIES: sigma-70 family RNA polymerase sigma factor [Bacteroides]MBW9198964.1 sigma-70 family RNA polymerase sigma factor [Bacteroidales bacterium SW299]MCR8916661.1 sigma-70 family RNA polymerase sigma factor [Bacteroides sp. ET225]MDM8207419.1 sigma-70 family RNA polymerase sigma factor [Bacteroides gallinaceum]MDM8325450.1 sigma-70 family RNA polymerase sigma factor [Bacteroides gallinaceum]
MKKTEHLRDDMLIEAYRQTQSQKAALALHKRYEPLIRRLIQNVILNHEEQMDLMQEIEIKIFQSLLLSYTEQGKFKQWVKTITVNMINDYLRRRAKAPQMIDCDINSLPALYYDERKEQQHKEKIYRIIEVVIQQLSPAHRLLLQKVFFENKSFREISQELGISKSGSHKRLKSLFPKIEQTLREMGINGLESDW